MFPLPLFRHPQDAFHDQGAGAGRLSRRIWHVRRVVRGADPDPDRQDRTDPRHHVRSRILGTGDQFRRHGDGRDDRSRGQGSAELRRDRRGGLEHHRRVLSPAALIRQFEGGSYELS
ncbi:hypothetical protein MTBLM5_40121 [Magnetospirillum sp. LM-5]|nr:hypothetical protein MTBLM5_40121 [Magnetospirillum sp. LM-5]